ncbi:MAG: hypothetical protein NDI77_12240 [Geobacteraceae bacterium]|nr:hypothetical protein [Geobacteraceae bacterium]
MDKAVFFRAPANALSYRFIYLTLDRGIHPAAPLMSHKKPMFFIIQLVNSLGTINAF